MLLIFLCLIGTSFYTQHANSEANKLLEVEGLPKPQESQQIIEKSIDDVNSTQHSSWHNMTPKEQDLARKNIIKNRKLQKEQDSNTPRSMSNYSIDTNSVIYNFKYKAKSDSEIQNFIEQFIVRMKDNVIFVTAFFLDLLKDVTKNISISKKQY